MEKERRLTLFYALFFFLVFSVTAFFYYFELTAVRPDTQISPAGSIDWQRLFD